MIYFHTYKSEFPLNIDIVQDIRKLNDMSIHSKQAGMMILGGGVCKHQIANAMLFVSRHVQLLMSSQIEFRPSIADKQRNGADYAVYINTGQEVCPIPLYIFRCNLLDRRVLIPAPLPSIIGVSLVIRC